MSQRKDETRDEWLARHRVEERQRHATKRDDPMFRAAARKRSRERNWNHPTAQLIREAREKPCVDCGRQHPFPAMDLDHVRGSKAFKISVPASCALPIEDVRAEIEKCDVRCAVCHRLRHSKSWERAA